MSIYLTLFICLLFMSGVILKEHLIEAHFELENDNNGVECQFGRALRKQVKPTPLGGMCLKDIVSRLSKTLRSIGNDELGLEEFQRILDQLDFYEVPDDPAAALESLVDNINLQLEKFYDILQRSLDIVTPMLEKNAYEQYLYSEQTQFQAQQEKSRDFCTQVEQALANNLRYDRWKQLRILPIKRPGKICGQAGPVRNIGSLFLSQCNKSRNVIVLMEHGTFMSEEDIALARATAKTMVDMLSDLDSVTFVGLADQSSIYCKDNLLKAIDVNKYQLIRKIDSTMRIDVENESLAIDFKSLTKNLNGDVVVVHITNTLKDVSNVENIVKSISSNNLTVYFRTALILSDLKPSVNVEETFINESTATLPTNNPLGYDIARLFANLDCPQANKKNFYLSDVFLDPFGKTLSVSIARATDKVLISLDVKLREFVEKITYFNAGPMNSAILFDKKGLVWMHKNFPRIETLVEQPIKVYLKDIENLDQSLVEEMITIAQGSKLMQNNLNKVVKLNWKHLKYLDLIVCIVSETKNITRSVAKFPPPLPENILHHRLDLVSQSLADSAELCLDRRSIVSPLSAVMYLSPWSLNSWREDLTSLMNLQSYMAYIKDATRLLANPGLGQFVRRDAAMLAQIIDHFKERHANSPSKMFFIRRYVAAIESGVIEVYPGMALDSSLDPRKRAWYGKAIDYPSKIVLTGPYLDAGGAGYIISLSQTIFKGYNSTSHGPEDPIVAVSSLDTTIGYVARLLRDMLPFCNESMIRCFLMDDKGYLIFHPSFLEPAGKLEAQHLTHKEHLVAVDILNHEFFVKKKVCANHLDGTIQRYYQFNTSLSEVLTNIIHGENCVKYQIASVPDTNLFFGVVNETCAFSAFCPCSTMDRFCFNCKRMEQIECECPCECSLYSSGCKNTSSVNNIEPCVPPYEQGIVLTTRWDRVSIPAHLTLNQCPSLNCKAYTSESECLGIVGCQWCSLDIDGESFLGNPFCSEDYTCFKGILGTPLPYSDGFYNSQAAGDSVGKEWPSVGPVAGGILAIVLIFGVALFCYRLHSVQSGLEHQCLHLHGSPDTLRMTHMDIGLGGSAIDADPIELERSKNHLDSLLHESTPPISPYRVSSGYRRPPGGDSDHGYSTMTPHDDTEQQSFAEPLLLVNATLDSEFNCTRPISPITHLESPHRVLVPVTVHRNMETSYC